MTVVQVLFCCLFFVVLCGGIVLIASVLLRIAAALSKIETAIEDGDLRIRNVTDYGRDRAYDEYMRAVRAGTLPT